MTGGKNKKRGSLIFFILFFLLVLNESGQPAQIANTIPAFGEFKIVYEESVIVSESDNDIHRMFSNILDLEIDSNDRLYLLDNNRVSLFDHTGKFLNFIGRAGQGPAEYTSPIGISIDSRDNLYVNDQGRSILVYNLFGKCLKRINLKALLSDEFFVDDYGNIFGFIQEIMPSGIYRTLSKIGPDGKTIASINTFLMKGYNIRSSSGVGGVLSGVKHPYSIDCFFCPVLRSQICWGANSLYEIKMFDLAGHYILRFLKSEKAQSISEEVAKAERTWGKAYVKNNMVFPDHKPFFRGLLSDEKGRIYVLRVGSLFNQDKKQVIDIFDKNGHYIYKTVLPYTPGLMRRGCFYVVDQNNEGRISIKKIRIINFDSLQEGVNF